METNAPYTVLTPLIEAQIQRCSELVERFSETADASHGCVKQALALRQASEKYAPTERRRVDLEVAGVIREAGQHELRGFELCREYLVDSVLWQQQLREALDSLPRERMSSQNWVDKLSAPASDTQRILSDALGTMDMLADTRNMSELIANMEGASIDYQHRIDRMFALNEELAELLCQSRLLPGESAAIAERLLDRREKLAAESGEERACKVAQSSIISGAASLCRTLGNSQVALAYCAQPPEKSGEASHGVGGR